MLSFVFRPTITKIGLQNLLSRFSRGLAPPSAFCISLPGVGVQGFASPSILVALFRIFRSVGNVVVEVTHLGPGLLINYHVRPGRHTTLNTKSLKQKNVCKG